jgi:hypothetical protein
MRYWGVLAAKLAVAVAALCGGWIGLRRVLPASAPQLDPDLPPFGHDLWFTLAALGFWLVSIGVAYLIVLDHRYRCRTCLRRLRMPLARGSWNQMLLAGPPRTEYICPYGHGTLRVSEVQLTGPDRPNWEPNQDIWTELSLLEDKK